MNLPIVDPNDPTLSDAFAQLAADEAGASPDPQPETTPTPDSVPDAPTTPEPDKTTEVPTPKPTPEGTPATAPEAQSPTPDKLPSKYEKAASRQAEAWKSINAEKDEVRNLRKQIEADREAVKAERQTIESEKAKLSQPKYKPEDYEAAAEKWENEGELKMAEAARKMAKELRDNPPKPPPDAKAQEESFKALQKEWWGKAGVDFPNVLKQDTAEAKALAELVKSEPAIYNDPKGMYYAARLVTAEAASARVPTMVKELGEAHAKIKDLEQKLAVPSDGVVSGAPKGDVPYEQRTESEQESELESMARGMDANGSWR